MCYTVMKTKNTLKRMVKTRVCLQTRIKDNLDNIELIYRISYNCSLQKDRKLNLLNVFFPCSLNFYFKSIQRSFEA